MPAIHRYTTRTSWTGSTGAGYDAYDRTHEASAPPAHATATLSSDPAFKGDPRLLNPEQLLVLAASSCQLLSFLTVAARARIDVVAYEDDAEAEMPEEPRPARVTKIVLRPRISIATTEARPLPPRAKLDRLVAVAHRECFIANSLTTAIVIEPTFLPVAPSSWTVVA